MREYDIVCILNVNAQNVHFLGHTSYIITWVSIQTKFIWIVFEKKYVSGHEGYWRPEQECENCSINYEAQHRIFVAVIGVS